MLEQIADSRSWVCPRRGGHAPADPDALRDATVLRIVKAGVGDLQTSDRCLDGRQPAREARLADRLGIAQSSHMRGQDVRLRKLRIDALQRAKGFRQQGRIAPAELRMIDRHVVRDVHDGSTLHRTQIRELNDARDRDAGFRDIDPEMRTNRTLQLEDQAADADVMDRVVVALQRRRQVRNQARNERRRDGRDDGVGRVKAVRRRDASRAALLDDDLQRGTIQADCAAA